MGVRPSLESIAEAPCSLVKKCDKDRGSSTTASTTEGMDSKKNAAHVANVTRWREQE